MKRFLFIALFVLLSTCLGHAQAVASGTTYDWPAVSTTGQVGQYANFTYAGPAAPSHMTIDWTVTGTAPTACTFRIEGSSDGTNWAGLDATAPAVDQYPCTSFNMIHIDDRPVRLLRINVVSYTAGDATTKVIFHYTMGR